MTSLAIYAAGGVAVALVTEFVAAWAIALAVLAVLVVIAAAWRHAGAEPQHTDHHHVRVIRPPYDWEQDEWPEC